MARNGRGSLFKPHLASQWYVDYNFTIAHAGSATGTAASAGAIPGDGVGLVATGTAAAYDAHGGSFTIVNPPAATAAGTAIQPTVIPVAAGAATGTATAQVTEAIITVTSGDYIAGQTMPPGVAPQPASAAGVGAASALASAAPTAITATASGTGLLISKLPTATTANVAAVAQDATTTSTHTTATAVGASAVATAGGLDTNALIVTSTGVAAAAGAAQSATCPVNTTSIGTAAGVGVALAYDTTYGALKLDAGGYLLTLNGAHILLDSVYGIVLIDVRPPDAVGVGNALDLRKAPFRGRLVPVGR